MSCEKQTQALALLLEPRCAPEKLGRTHVEDAALPGLSIHVSAHGLAAVLGSRLR